MSSPPSHLTIYDHIHGSISKSNLKFFEIDGAVSASLGWRLGGKRDEVLGFGQNVAGCVHIDTVLSSVNGFIFRETSDG